MVRKLFSIRDSKVGAFNVPFIAHTDGEATRMLERAAKTPNHDVNMFPADYDLFELGEFDDNTGRYKNLDAPKHIANAKLLTEG